MSTAFLMAARKLCRNNNKTPISISYSFPLTDRHAGNAGSDLLFQEIHLFTTPTKNIITNHSWLRDYLKARAHWICLSLLCIYNVWLRFKWTPNNCKSLSLSHWISHLQCTITRMNGSRDYNANCSRSFNGYIDSPVHPVHFQIVHMWGICTVVQSWSSSIINYSGFIRMMMRTRKRPKDMFYTSPCNMESEWVS